MFKFGSTGFPCFNLVLSRDTDREATLFPRYIRRSHEDQGEEREGERERFHTSLHGWSHRLIDVAFITS